MAIHAVRRAVKGRKLVEWGNLLQPWLRMQCQERGPVAVFAELDTPALERTSGAASPPVAAALFAARVAHASPPQLHGSGCADGQLLSPGHADGYQPTDSDLSGANVAQRHDSERVCRRRAAGGIA